MDNVFASLIDRENHEFIYHVVCLGPLLECNVRAICHLFTFGHMEMCVSVHSEWCVLSTNISLDE